MYTSYVSCRGTMFFAGLDVADIIVDKIQDGKY